MIIVKILGGLGNQIFQYSYAKSLQQKGYKVKIDISAFKNYKLSDYFLDRYLIDIERAKEEDLSLYNSSNIITKLKEQGEDGRVIAAEMEKRTKKVFPES